MILLALVACGDDQPVRHDAAVDAFQYRDAGIDAPSCGASGSCANGPACGSGCCGSGEYCANGTCMCGAGSACTDGNTCQPGGPIAPTYCGSICCGATMGCPI
jgi:hypothetical protein